MRPLTPMIALALVSWPAIATARDQHAADRRGAEDVTPPAPAGRNENFLDGVAFDLSVDEDEAKASMQVGGYASRTAFTGGGNASQTNLLWSIKAEVPVGGSSDLTSRSSLDALSDGSRLTLDLSLFGFKSAAANSSSPAFDRIMVSARRNCEVEAADEPDSTQAQIDQQVARCRNARNEPAFARKYSDYSDNAINRTLFSGIWRVGAEASIGVDRFAYIDAATLGEKKKSKIQYSAALFFAYYPSDAVSAVVARGEYQRAYEAADEAIICRPVVTDPDADCVNGISGPPTEIERLNLSLEYRRVFDSGWRRGSFATSPRATIDALSGEWEAELPIYFIPRGDSPISPGVKVAYSSEKDKVAFGLFMRSTFSF